MTLGIHRKERKILLSSNIRNRGEQFVHHGPLIICRIGADEIGKNRGDLEMTDKLIPIAGRAEKAEARAKARTEKAEARAKAKAAKADFILRMHIFKCKNMAKKKANAK